MGGRIVKDSQKYEYVLKKVPGGTMYCLYKYRLAIKGKSQYELIGRLSKDFDKACVKAFDKLGSCLCGKTYKLR